MVSMMLKKLLQIISKINCKINKHDTQFYVSRKTSLMRSVCKICHVEHLSNLKPFPNWILMRSIEGRPYVIEED